MLQLFNKLLNRINTLETDVNRYIRVVQNSNGYFDQRVLDDFTIEKSELHQTRVACELMREKFNLMNQKEVKDWQENCAKRLNQIQKYNQGFQELVSQYNEWKRQQGSIQQAEEKERAERNKQEREKREAENIASELLNTIIYAVVATKDKTKEDTKETVVGMMKGDVVEERVLDWEYVEPVDNACKRIFGEDIGPEQRNTYIKTIVGMIDARWETSNFTNHYEGRLKERVKDKHRNIYEGMKAKEWAKFIKERIGRDEGLFSVDVGGKQIKKVAIEYRWDKQMHRLVLGFKDGGMAVVTIIIN